MDKQLIDKYGEDILCYRLRTARQKKRMQNEDFDKYLIQLDKEESSLYKQIRNLGWEPLYPPIQKGWVRSFELREDVARHKHADFFEGILKKINTYQYDWKKDFKQKRRKFGRKIYVPRAQSILSPETWHFKKLNFSEAEKQFFSEVWEFNKNWGWQKRFVFNEPWRFVLRIKPNMIDKVRKRDAELETKLKSIQNYVEKNNLTGRQMKLIHGHYPWNKRDFEKYNQISIYKGKNLCQILDAIKDE